MCGTFLEILYFGAELFCFFITKVAEPFGHLTALGLLPKIAHIL